MPRKDKVGVELKALTERIDLLLERLETGQRDTAEFARVLAEALRNGVKPSSELNSVLDTQVHRVENMMVGYAQRFDNAVAAQMSQIVGGLQTLVWRFDLLAKQKLVEYIPDKHSTYISQNESISVSTKAYDVNVLKTLGRVGRYGYIASDGGTINIRVNEGETVPLNQSEVFRIRVEQNFEIEKLRITTTSAASISFRVFIA